ncbi:hypothetical protein B9G55_07280 [Saccharibacillus sp. O16]|nr:hypothetical protein B9G55_07280 [Saccharibacillus sp. O16]
MQDVWIESWHPSVTESDFAGRVRPSALLGVMQNAADHHLEDAGVTVARMLEAGMAWILMTTRLELRSLPRLGEQLILETWNCGASGVLWTRDYRLLGADGEELAAASTAWTLVDLSKRRIMRPSAFPFPLPVSSRAAGAVAADKVSLPGEEAAWSEAGSYTVPYSVVDCYGHMNNARYADLCMDLLTAEELEHQQLRAIHLTYSREAARGETIALRCGRIESTVFISGESESGRRTFEAALEMEYRS